jgi:glycosyltransferase involved in cell wall biosynthesis
LAELAGVKLTVAIPTFGRDQVLVDSLEALLSLEAEDWELLIVDQTAQHDATTQQRLQAWSDEGQLRWIRQFPASTTAAMNRALLEARGRDVLFLDDDILPDPELLRAHQAAADRHPGAMIAGRVLQPWHRGQPDDEDGPFGFNSLQPRSLDEFMGGNVCLPREAALALGGFDRNFVRVAYRFEAEFAHRWRQAGHRIAYEPGALIHHLKAERGGTRSFGHHLTTLRPDHAVGRYYFLLRTQPLPAALGASGRELARSVRSRHHLRRPWWIPLTLTAELRGLAWALRLYAHGPRLAPPARPRLLIASSHPIQYQAPLFRALASCPDLDPEVLLLCLPDADQQGEGFGVAFDWDVPLLEGYRWRQAASCTGSGLGSGFRGLRLRHPGRELVGGGRMPEAVLITGWQVQGLLQLYWAAWRRRVPILLRVEAADQPRRRWPVRLLHRFLVGQAAACLPIGQANTRFYRASGAKADRLFASPYFVDNDFFTDRAASLRHDREALRARWSIPADSFCFLFAGKLQTKKHPLDLLEALARLVADPSSPRLHLLLVGSGDLESACRERVRQQDLPVSFAGFLNQGQIPAAYVAADALVLPSDRGETWGLVVNEAMACGLPAIVSNQVGCAEDLVEPAQTGAVFPCRDVNALSLAMKSLAADPEAAARMGQTARERVLAGYGVAQALAGVRQALAQVLRTG